MVPSEAPFFKKIKPPALFGCLFLSLMKFEAFFGTGTLADSFIFESGTSPQLHVRMTAASPSSPRKAQVIICGCAILSTLAASFWLFDPSHAGGERIDAGCRAAGPSNSP